MTSDEQAAISVIRYLNLSNSTTSDVATLRDRIYHAHEKAMYGRVAVPQTPFQVERIRTIASG